MLRTLALVSLVGTPVFAQTTIPESQPPAEHLTVFYQGTINKNLEIELVLTRTGQSIAGSYQYASQLKPLRLEGTVLGGTKLRITEYAAKEVGTGAFDLELLQGWSELQGNWSGADGRRIYSVYLWQIDEKHYTELQREWKDRSAKQTTGFAKNQALLDRLESDNEKARNRALQEAQDLTPDVKSRLISQLIETLPHKGLDGYFASLSLGGLGEPATAALIDTLRKPDATARNHASLALGRVGSPAIAQLIDALADGSPEVRCAAASSLTIMEAKATQAVPTLSSLLQNNSNDVRVCAIRALGAIGSNEALDALRAELKDVPLQPTTLNAIALFKKRASKATDDVISLLSSTNPLTRGCAAATLGAIAPPSPPVIAALIRSLSDPHQSNRGVVVAALGNFGGDAAIAVPEIRQLLRLAKSDDPFLKQRAVEALGKIGPGAKDSVPELIPLWQDPDAYLRRSAVEAVGRIGPSASPTLISALHDANPEIRSGAAWQLGEFRSVEAVPALTAALKDGEPTVQVAAKQALEKISTPEAQAALARTQPPSTPPRLLTRAQIESLIPPAEGQRSPLKLTTTSGLNGPAGIVLLATLHQSDDRGDLLRIWRPVGDKYELIHEINDVDGEPSVAAYERPEGFTLDGEYFVHLMFLYSGTGFGHEDTILWIAPDTTLHEVKFVSGAAAYQNQLLKGEAVLKGEMDRFADSNATFSFGVWKDGDANCCPSAGEVQGHFKLIGSKHYDSTAKKWSADFQIVPATFKRGQ